MKESFSNLYTRLYNENITELEELRKKEKSKALVIIILIASIFGCIMFLPFLAFILVPLLMVVVIIIAIKNMAGIKSSNKGSYASVFKEKIVTPIISNVFEDGKYEPQRGWSRMEYLEGEYRDFFDRYSSEDMLTATITGNDNNKTTIQFAEVHTERETEDSEGRTSYVTVFCGLAGKMGLSKDIGTKIYIRNNGIFNSLSKNRVKLDMSEFEKKFDVECEDKILAVRLLTADVMTEMLDLYNKFKYRFEIHILRDKIYMRIYTGKVFEPNLFQNSMEYKTVEKYYLTLQAMMNISKHINDKLNELDV